MYNFSGRAYLRLANRLDLLAQYKVSERDNKTPVDVYTPILLDVLQSSPRSNRPYGYERDTATLELRYRPTYNLRLNAGAKQDKLERTYQSVRKTDEDTYWGEIQFSPWAWISARLKVDQSDRSTTPYEQIGNFERAENPLMRKFNMAERDRDRSTFEIDLSPTDKLGINLSYFTTEDDYEASEIGLRSGEEESFSLDLNYAFNKTTNLYVFFTEDEIESEMSAAEEFDAVPWDAFTEDEVQTWGLGLSGQFTEKLSYGFDYVSSESEGEILTDSGLGEEPFPVLETDLTNTRVYLSYQFNDKWSLGLDAYREEYETSDWLIDGLGPYDIRAVMTMGETSPDYEVNVYRLLTTYRF
jgi:MtrB/PioB family decaheme-associated outer membrane protein